MIPDYFTMELEENNRLSEKGNNCCSLEQLSHAAVHKNEASFSQEMEKNDTSLIVRNYEDLSVHVLVEELLQLLVDVVDANLLEAVVVEDLEAGNVEDTNVGDLLHGGVAQGLVTLVHLS